MNNIFQQTLHRKLHKFRKSPLMFLELGGKEFERGKMVNWALDHSCNRRNGRSNQSLAVWTLKSKQKYLGEWEGV